MKIGGTSTNNIDVWDFADQRPEDADLKGLQEATSNVYGNGHTLVYADMMDAIAQDRPPYIDAKAAAEPGDDPGHVSVRGHGTAGEAAAEGCGLHGLYRALLPLTGLNVPQGIEAPVPV